MGVDVCLKVKNLTLLCRKSFFDKEIYNKFFTKENLIVTENVKYDDYDIGETPHTEYKYVSSVSNVIDRLNSIGYTLKKIENEFNNKKLIALDYFPLMKSLGIDYDDEEKITNRINSLITFKKWCNSLKKYFKYLLDDKDDIFLWEHDTPIELQPRNDSDKIILSSLKDFQSESFYGCFYDKFDVINTIRLLLEYCDKNEKIELDITELIGWTYDSIEDVKLDDDVEKTIILVEGSSDKSILEFALAKIYPHLSNLYYFMDFDYSTNNKRPGGADAIEKNIKTFITSKLKAKFIAIFDNDAIGIQAQKALIQDIGVIPANFKITNYPFIKDAKKYPTILPDKKIKTMDINGKACSIELYLPQELLKDDSDKLYPIQWKGIVERKIGKDKISDYQGEIQNKDKIKSSFKTLMRDIELKIKEFNINDWQNIKNILDHIIHIFE